jgi:hypothetical protein
MHAALTRDGTLTFGKVVREAINQLRTPAFFFMTF